MQYTETELARLIETVETEFTAHLSKAEDAHKATLAKSEDGEKKEAKPSDKKPEDKKAPEAEAKPAEEKPAAPAEGEQPPAPAADAAAPAAASPAAPASAAPAGHGYDDEDMAHMDKMYASMSREELMAHHDSIRKALDAQGAAQAPAPAAAAPAPAAEGAINKSEIKDENPILNSKPSEKGSETNTEYNKNSGGAQSGTGEPHGSPGAKSPASKAEGVQMEKSEKPEMELLKNELEAEKAKGVELKKNFDAVQEILTKIVGKISAPKGKAITEIATLAKNEGSGETPSLSKTEITEKLFKKSSDPKLEKSDRAAINEFYASGQVNINSISHLLK